MKKTTLVLGASTNENRYSNRAVKRLRANSIPVIAHGIKEGMIEDVKIILTLEDWSEIDTITLYLSEKHQEKYFDFIVKVNPNRVIFNPGTENLKLEALLDEHEINYEHACTLVMLSLGNY